MILGLMGVPEAGPQPSRQLQSDPQTYLSVEPEWRPVFPSRLHGDFGFFDLFRFAGLDAGHPRQE